MGSFVCLFRIKEHISSSYCFIIDLKSAMKKYNHYNAGYLETISEACTLYSKGAYAPLINYSSNSPDRERTNSVHACFLLLFLQR